MVIDALENGMNKKRLLQCVGMDEQEFDLCVYYKKFTMTEIRILRQCIEEWNADQG
jgi:hypothetical protein